jgi:hypothetical protein
VRSWSRPEVFIVGMMCGLALALFLSVRIRIPGVTF